ncbi:MULTISPECIES: MFS transporter [unclassified Sedimentibacter]|uniref:MFS transporter n=1 Tax=unclassified Sedimentibacter TaxID=2649220 RepID=UPI0027DED487|nr:MFS transporter [Sedimentibacter sp. MB35-C1]WMJ76841.1 MFS transporter [Sedimentibacter sp. MB35-C1]
MYDVGNSAFILLVSTIIPIYFKNIATGSGISASNSTAYWGYAVSISTLIVAIIGPILGTLADTKGYKKPLFTAFLLIGAIGCAALSISASWFVFLFIFVIAKIGISGSLIFYDSMLPDVTAEDKMDLLSSLGYAWGYIGSCVPFTLSLVIILFSDKLYITASNATKFAFILTAAWWVAASFPLLKNYRQIYYVETKKNAIREALVRLKNTFMDIKNQKEIFIFLMAFFFYIDGVYTIIEMATSYGKDVGISDNNLLFALLLTQVVAFPFALMFGKLSKKYKTKDLINVSIIGYFLITIFALQLDKAWEFWFLAVCVAMFQGAIQALSRSYFAKIIPKEKSSEYFGFFDIFGKGASFTGAFIMGLTTQISGNSKTGVASIAIMFIIGYFMFNRAVKMNR